MKRLASIMAVGALAGALIAYAAWPQDYQLPPPDVVGAISGDGLDRICKPGYSQSVRPPEATTEAIKWHMMGIYAPHQSMRDFELDHLTPLCLGGAPLDDRNLWLQPIREAKIKDRLETRLCKAVCNGEIGLTEAQRCIADDWVKCYKQEMGISP